MTRQLFVLLLLLLKNPAKIVPPFSCLLQTIIHFLYEYTVYALRKRLFYSEIREPLRTIQTTKIILTNTV